MSGEIIDFDSYRKAKGIETKAFDEPRASTDMANAANEAAVLYRAAALLVEKTQSADCLEYRILPFRGYADMFLLPAVNNANCIKHVAYTRIAGCASLNGYTEGETLTDCARYTYGVVVCDGVLGFLFRQDKRVQAVQTAAQLCRLSRNGLALNIPNEPEAFGKTVESTLAASFKSVKRVEATTDIRSFRSVILIAESRI